MKGNVSEVGANVYGPTISKLIEEFAALPGIGPKSAERLANYILSCDKNKAFALAEAIRAVKERIRPCRRCFFYSEQELCAICTDPRRNQQVLCVVEQPKDVIALEASGAYDGLYHVLHGHLSPLEGIGPNDLTIDALVERVKNENIQEVIMATNPTVEGDGTALYISNLLSEMPVKITRLARGIASGSVLEFANRDMLADALRCRQDF